jgi:hypothetical protein
MATAQQPDNAAGALAEIGRRQSQVIEAVLVPGWYWWAVGAAMVVIGAAADYRHTLVLAVAIPVAVIAIVALTGAMILGAYRQVRIRDTELLGGRGAIAIVSMVGLIVGLTLGVGFGLRALGSPAPATIATAVGAAALTVGGPPLMRCLRRIMHGRRAGAGA